MCVCVSVGVQVRAAQVPVWVCVWVCVLLTPVEVMLVRVLKKENEDIAQPLLSCYIGY